MRDEGLLRFLAMAAAVVCVVTMGIVLWAQPVEVEWREYPKTRVWTITAERPYDIDMTVQVIDTAGVCLYITYDQGAIAAVPKTQLPVGRGCQ